MDSIVTPPPNGSGDSSSHQQDSNPTEKLLRTPTSTKENVQYLSIPSDDNLKIPPDLFANFDNFENNPIEPSSPQTSDTEEQQHEYEEEDLENFAESLAPRVTSLIQSNEAALDDFMSSTRNMSGQKYTNEYESDSDEEGALLLNSNSFAHEDGIEMELDRLADSERQLRDELDNNKQEYNFMKYENLMKYEGFATDSEDENSQSGSSDQFEPYQEFQFEAFGGTGAKGLLQKESDNNKELQFEEFFGTGAEGLLKKELNLFSQEAI